MRLIVSAPYQHLSEALRNVVTHFGTTGTVVYEARNTLRRFTLQGVEMVGKQFAVPHLINRIAYTLLRPSKAARSFRNATELCRRGFLSPAPVAYAEERRGLLSRSWYVCLADNGSEVRSLMNGAVEGHEAELRAFAAYAARLHEAGVLHLDFSPGNILIHPDLTFSLVDVNRFRFLHSPVGEREAAFNLRRLCRSRSVLRFVGRAYAEARGFAPDAFVQAAEAMSDTFFLRFMYRRARKRGTLGAMRLRIAAFRLSRAARKHLPLPAAWATAMQESERNFYLTHLAPYDYRRTLLPCYAVAEALTASPQG